MKTRELLLECKLKKKISSDYGLATELEIPRQRISEYMKNERKADEYAAFKIAECLERDPAHVLAEINAETGGKHAEYFRNFLQRRGLLGLVGVSLLTYSVSFTPEAAAANEAHTDAARIMLRKVKRRRLRALPLDSTQTAHCWRFFFTLKTCLHEGGRGQG